MWNELTTTSLTPDSSYYYYSANTPGFSYFAITASKLENATTVETPTEAQDEQVQASPSAKMLTEQEAVSGPEIKNITEKFNLNLQSLTVSLRGNEALFGLVAGLAIVFLLIYLRFKLKPKHHSIRVRVKH
jgi:hypothetical protein